MAATPVTPNPVRAEELVLPLATFVQGDFTIFLPSVLAPLAALGGIVNPKVHVFFAAAGVQTDVANDVLVHGLRSAANNSDWILIAVRGIPGSSRAISDAEIRSCLSGVGINAAPAILRLSAHSRGCDSLVASVAPGKITTLPIIDRVVFLDQAVSHAAKDSPTPGVITKNRVALLKKRGIPATRMVAYEVGNRSVEPTGASAHIPGATYFELPPNGMAAIGCVRLIGDGIVRDPALGVTIAASQPLVNQIAPMLMPARGSFSVMVPGGQDLKQYCQDHTAAISQIVANLATPQSSLLKLVNDNDLGRFGGYEFSWGGAAHHFFVAEIAHELTS